jgi:hypothetical protein
MNKSIKLSIKAAKKDFRYFRLLALDILTRGAAKEKPLIRYYEKGSISPNYDRPICLFCSYDKENIIRDNVYYYLNELVLAGFDIVFISSSDIISEADLQKLSGYCIRIMNRENKGYDFYGWKTGLEKYPQYNDHLGLLLVNDSVLGPLFSIKDIIPKLENCDADIIGMTECFRYHLHLQSYFLYCKKNVILSEEFIRFFREVKVLELKIAIIRKYEVGFSRILGRRFRILALFGLEYIIAKIGYSKRPIRWIEPTFHIWRPLITEFKFPFLKKSIFTRKDVSIKEISSALAESGTSYKIEL